MKVTIITVALNSAKTIVSTLQSVSQQSYDDIEHIVVDGLSIDNTVAIASSYPHVSNIISEKDHGIYDAINKGIRAASGDIIGILNSDDFYPNPDVIATIVSTFQRTDCQATIGDICFVDAKNISVKTRYSSSKKWKPTDLKKGYMPPHPSLFIHKDAYRSLGLYDNSYQIAGDFDLITRFFSQPEFKYIYIPGPAVFMRTGGISNRNFKNRMILNREIIKSCRKNGLDTSYLSISFRYLNKIRELYFLNILKIRLNQSRMKVTNAFFTYVIPAKKFSILMRYLVSFIPAFFLY